MAGSCTWDMHTIVCLLSLAGAVRCLARGCDCAPPPASPNGHGGLLGRTLALFIKNNRPLHGWKTSLVLMPNGEKLRLGGPWKEVLLISDAGYFSLGALDLLIPMWKRDPFLAPTYKRGSQQMPLEECGVYAHQTMVVECLVVI